MAKTQKNGRTGKPPRKELNTRFQIRCSTDDVAAWEDRAAALGYGGASAWLRKVANDALKQPLPR